MKNYKNTIDYMKLMKLNEYAVSPYLFELILKELGYKKPSFAKMYESGVSANGKRILVKG